MFKILQWNYKKLSNDVHLNIEDCNLFSQSAFKGFFAGNVTFFFLIGLSIRIVT